MPNIKSKEEIPLSERWEKNMLVNDEELSICMNVGKAKARQISEEVGARIPFGRRRLNDPALIKSCYLNKQKEMK